MNKHIVALVLDEIASLLALADAERFRVRAYRTAARAVDRLEGDIAERLAAGDLDREWGLGPATIGVIRELVETGHSRLYDRLRQETPAGIVQLRSVSGLGPKRIHTLHDRLGIESLDDLREAAESGRVAALPGFGPATQRSILSGLDFVDRSAGRRRQPDAFAAADRVIGYLETLPVLSVHLAGELRRRCETAEGIRLVVVTEDSGAVLDGFVAIPGLTRPERTGNDRAVGWLADGAPVRVRCVAPTSAAAARVAETGSSAHVARLVERARERGLELDEDGLYRDGTPVPLEDESDLYRALELEWVPPELREGLGEVEAAERGSLPRLVEYDDLRGTFHCHTTYSDGTASVAEMAEGAAERGWRYLGIADHSQSAFYAGGLTVEDVRRQHAEIDAWNAEHGDRVRVFKGTESDILTDGSLDFPDDVLAEFDYVIGSVHGGFRSSREAMTHRLVAAAGHPSLTIVGHLTGRLLLSREPYPVDVEAVLDAVAGSGAAIEINGDPHRMDMDWRYWPGAKRRGIRCAINPDAHSVRGLGAVLWGVSMARKGWLEPGDVINCWEVERVERYLEGGE